MYISTQINPDSIVFSETKYSDNSLVFYFAKIVILLLDVTGLSQDVSMFRLSKENSLIDGENVNDC